MKIIDQSKKILESNWKNGYTIPSPKLYPFQWNWDSGFTALGWSHFDIEKAITEFETLFKGQWKNGMLPHIAFHTENTKDYFPNADYWNSQSSKFSPNQLKTSGITQPPVHAFIIEEINKQHHDNSKFQDFMMSIIPKLIRLHTYFIKNRDPHHEHLIYINHPWESGMDNSPYWDHAYHQITLETKPIYKRVDNVLVNADERPNQYFYDRCIYLLNTYKSKQYNDQEIYKTTPFAVQCVLFNSIFIRSTEALINIGKMYGFEISEFKVWHEKAKYAFNQKFWDEKLEIYVPYDLKHKSQISIKNIAGLIPLVAGIPNKERSEKLVAHLQSPSFKGSGADRNYLCATSDAQHATFDSKKYWRGPIWMPTNWLLYKGLRRNNFDMMAKQLKSDSLELVERQGFYEYFEPNKKHAATLKDGYGGDSFSWTAALALDLLTEKLP